MKEEVTYPRLMYKYKKILVIDDSDMQRYITEMILKKNLFAETVIGFVGAEFALTHLEAIEEQPEEYPDRILLDIDMPGLDGFGFMDKFAELPDGLKQHCRIIILTSSLEEADRRRAFTYPFVIKYLSKPFVTRMLAEL